MRDADEERRIAMKLRQALGLIENAYTILWQAGQTAGAWRQPNRLSTLQTQTDILGLAVKGLYYQIMDSLPVMDDEAE